MKNKLLTLLILNVLFLEKTYSNPINTKNPAPFKPFNPSIKGESALFQQKSKAKSMADITTGAIDDLYKTGADTEQVRMDKTYLDQFTDPWLDVNPDEMINGMNFNNSELTELLKFLENNLKIKFILDDILSPTNPEMGLQPLAGTKITFKANTPLSLKEVWELGLTFLDMAGFAIIPGPLPKTYRVTASASKDNRPSANRDPLPTYVGTPPNLLPNDDLKIRYVYFVENAELQTVERVIDAMRSGTSAQLISIPQIRAIIITDKSSSIKSMLEVIREIDNINLPEELAVIKLQYSDAQNVANLYNDLVGKKPDQSFSFYRQKKPTTTQYFNDSTRVFAEPRTNSLIVLGTRENIKKVEDFIFKHIDKTADTNFASVFVLQLNHINAISTAKLINETITTFNTNPNNKNTALVGGIRDGNKFFTPQVYLVAEPASNKIIIKADYEEYLKIREILEKLDVEQPQVAIKVLLLNVDLTNLKTLGTQIRNQANCCNTTPGAGLFGNKVNFQYAGIGNVVTTDSVNNGGTTSSNGAFRLLGNLLNLADSINGNSIFGPGTTLLTLGKDMFGFSSLLQILETYTRSSVIANPFLVTTNNYKSEIKVGETRRVVTSTVQGLQQAQAQGDLNAMLRVVLRPQVSYDNMVKLDVYIELGQFIDATSQERLIKKISTEAFLADKEVLALGGLIQDTITEVETKIPILGDIPILGFLAKNKTKTIRKTSLLILISPEIIQPHNPRVAEKFTSEKMIQAKETLADMRSNAERRGPIHRWFFRDNKDTEVKSIDNFIKTQSKYLDVTHQALAIPPTNMEKASNPANKNLLDLVTSEENRDNS